MPAEHGRRLAGAGHRRRGSGRHQTMSAIDQPPEVLGKMIGGALVGTFLGVFLAYGLVAPSHSARRRSPSRTNRSMTSSKSVLSPVCISTPRTCVSRSDVRPHPTMSARSATGERAVNSRGRRDRSVPHVCGAGGGTPQVTPTTRDGLIAEATDHLLNGEPLPSDRIVA